VVALLVVGVCALGRLDRGGAPSAPPNTTLPPPEVHVLYHGVEPRSAMRLSPEPGGWRTYELSLLETATLSSALEGRTDAEWGALLTVEGRVVSVEDGGRVHWRYRVVDTAVTSAESSGALSPEQWKGAVGSIDGFCADVRLDPRGFVQESTRRGNDLLPGTPASSLAQLLDLTFGEPVAHLPAEPVGRFAVWEVRRKAYDGEIVTNTVDRFELTGIEGGRMTVELKDSATADEQLVGEGGGSGALQSRVVEYSRRGEGEWTFGIDGALSLAGSGWTRTEVSLQQTVLEALQTGTSVESETEFEIKAM